MGFCKSEFFPVTAADTELVNPAVPDQLVTAAQNTGMTEPGSQIILTQICMGIKMYDVQIWIFFKDSTDRTQSDQMFSAK